MSARSMKIFSEKGNLFSAQHLLPSKQSAVISPKMSTLTLCPRNTNDAIAEAARDPHLHGCQHNPHYPTSCLHFFHLINRTSRSKGNLLQFHIAINWWSKF
ncbi:hypothetical protein ABKN59_003969 [Abortiporus biennis]